MKKVLLVLSFVFTGWLSTSAQDNTTQTMVRFDFIKVEPSKTVEYLKLESEWRKVNEVLRKEGKILRWMNYQVLLPSGSDVHHNYITVQIYKDYASLENIVADMAAAFAKVYPDRNYSEFINKTDQIRNRTRTEIFRNIDGYWNPDAFFQHKYARVDFMKTTTENSGAYVASEINFWKPAHKVAVASGKLNGWQLCSKLSSADGDEYNKLTVNFFTDFAQSETRQSDFEGWLRKAHPNLTDKELMEKLLGAVRLRSHHHSELIKLIDML